VIAQLATHGDAEEVVATRTRILVAVGALLIVSAGAGALLIRPHDDNGAVDSSPFPVGHVFTAPEWVKVRTALVARGFDGAAARIISGDRFQLNNAPFALVRATSPSRGVCFLPVRGTRPGPAMCSTDGRLPAPLLVFSARDRWANKAATAVVGVVRHTITGVSMVDRHGFQSGVALIPATGGLLSFAGGYGDTKLVVRARLASGRIVAQTTLH